MSRTEGKWVVRNLTGFVLVVLIMTVLFTSVGYMSAEIQMDEQTVSFMQNAYRTVGTLYTTEEVNRMYLPIQDGVIEQLRSSSYVSTIDPSDSYSAQLETGTITPYFQTFSMDTVTVFTGEVVDMYRDGSYSFGGIEGPRYRLFVRVEKSYTDYAPWFQEGDIVHVLLFLNMDEEIGVSIGDTCLILTESVLMNEAHELEIVTVDKTNTFLYASLDPFWHDQIILQYDLIRLPVFSNEEEKEEKIRSLIEEHGYEKYVQAVPNLKSQIALHSIKEMNDLMSTRSNDLFVIDGRLLHEADTGEHVCVVHQALADRNDWKVGDTIRVVAAEDAYESVAGFPTGVPHHGDFTKKDYITELDLTIVGVYAYSGVTSNLSWKRYGYNDILIPKELLPETEGQITPYALDFTIEGDQLQEFISMEIPKLEEMGYFVELTASRWEENRAYLEGIQENVKYIRLRMAVISIVVMALLMFVLYRQYSYEAILRRLLGADSKEIRKAVDVPYGLAMIISLILSIGLTYFLSVRMAQGLNSQTEGFVLAVKPLVVQCVFVGLGLMVVMTVCERLLVRSLLKRPLAELLRKQL